MRTRKPNIRYGERMSSTSDVDLAKDLAREIAQQADGTKQSERQKIKRMARAIEKLLDGSASDQDRQDAQAELHPSQQH